MIHISNPIERCVKICSLFDVFKQSIRNEEPSDWTGSVWYDESARAYLKIMAKNTVLDFVARTMSTLEVKFKNKDGNADWEYICCSNQ